MTCDTKKLRELANAATPGPWDDYYETGIRPCVMAYDENDKGLRTLRSYIADTQFPQDRAFIAAANPQAIIALIDELEEARELVADMFNQSCAELKAEIEKLHHDCGNHDISQADIDWCVICDRESNEATIARQARVIEKLKDVVTCVGCDANKSCPYAWDGYNTNGDCLAEK